MPSAEELLLKNFLRAPPIFSRAMTPPKAALLLLFLLLGALALPWFTARTMRRGWQKWRQTRSRTGLNGRQFAALLLHRSGLRGVGVVEKGRLFFETYDPAAGDLQLSEPVLGGRHLAALAQAALQVGCALQEHDGDKAWHRLLRWNRIMRWSVNLLPVFTALLLISPGKYRFLPLVLLLVLFLVAGQILTFPAVRDAAARGKKLVTDHQLLPPEELPEFSSALRAATQRHLAAPLLDCFWLRWLV